MESKQKYLFELLELVAEMDLCGTAVTDTDGTIIGVIIGEPEFIAEFDLNSDEDNTYH